MNIKTEPEFSPDSLELCVQKICWNCIYCNKVYASKRNRDSHIRNMHTAAKCAICGVVFPSINLLRKHHNNEHSDCAERLHDRVDVIDRKSSGEYSKIVQNERRNLTRTAASSKRKTKSELEGEVVEHDSQFSNSWLTPNA